jgi:hypothetical protein
VPSGVLDSAVATKRPSSQRTSATRPPPSSSEVLTSWGPSPGRVAPVASSLIVAPRYSPGPQTSTSRVISSIVETPESAIVRSSSAIMCSTTAFAPAAPPSARP